MAGVQPPRRRQELRRSVAGFLELVPHVDRRKRVIAGACHAVQADLIRL